MLFWSVVIRNNSLSEKLYLKFYWIENKIPVNSKCQSLTQPAFIYSKSIITWTIREICSKLTIRTPERRQLRLSGIFIVNFEQISYIVLVFSSLNLNKYWLQRLPLQKLKRFEFLLNLGVNKRYSYMFIFL